MHEQWIWNSRATRLGADSSRTRMIQASMSIAGYLEHYSNCYGECA